MQYIMLGLLGAVAGIFSGLFGLGGAVIVVPVLVFLFGFEQHMAQGTSLAMLLPPIGALAVWRYWQSGHVRLPVAIVMAMAFFAGGALGAHFAIGIPQPLMKRLFGAAMTAIGIFMMMSGR